MKTNYYVSIFICHNRTEFESQRAGTQGISTEFPVLMRKSALRRPDDSYHYKIAPWGCEHKRVERSL